MVFRRTVLASVFATFLFVFLYATSAHGQFGGLPDCDANPQNLFCQGQCAFVVPLPSWCESPPEPEPEPARQPVLLVPGLAASHNFKMILKDQAGGTWDFTPGIRQQWQPLIDRLEQEGYQLNRDLFVVFYDWRKSNTQSAVGYLIPVINQAKAISGKDKVDIIAHSMGGLVVRSYAQSENLYNDDIDQIIFLGTPNEGAAGTYIAWEGGDFPVNWDYKHKYWINRVERNLERTHDTGNIQPPLSFRTFFPSLKELLPINPFVTQDGSQLPIDSLAAQNDFLVNLKDTAYRLDDRGIIVTTVAGTDSQTQDNILISSNRTPTDLELARWRDGHPNSEPILPDSTSGDQTVLSSSVHAIGADSVTLSNLIHEELPGDTQDVVMARLIPNPIGDFFPSTLASAALGVDILSPISPQITGPNGEILSSTQNTFEDAYFDWDPDNPDDIKMLTIIDPPEGDYIVELTGTDDGDYTVITSYADENDDIFIEKEGDTTFGQEETYTFSINDDTFTFDFSLLELTQQLKDTIEELHKDHDGHKHNHKHIKHLGHLRGGVNKLHNHAKKYIKSLDKHGSDNKKTEKEYDKLLKAFNKFSEKLDKEIGKGHLDETAAVKIIPLRDAIQVALLQ